MRLADWFKARNSDGSRRRKGDLARHLGRCQASVTGYVQGRCIPPEALIGQIERYTGGEVSAADWPAERPFQ